MFAFLSVKGNSKEIYEEMSFPFFRKMLIKANYLQKMHSYPDFSSGIPVALAKICFFRVVLFVFNRHRPQVGAYFVV